MNATITSIQRVLRYMTIGCLATTAVIGAMAVLVGDIDLRTIATVLFVGIAAPMAMPMIQRLVDVRPIVRVIAITVLVINLLWLVGALWMVWGGSWFPVITELPRITSSLFVTALAVVVAMTLFAMRRISDGTTTVSMYVTLGFVATTYVCGLMLIWARDPYGTIIRMTIASSILMIAGLFITPALAIIQRKK